MHGLHPALLHHARRLERRWLTAVDESALANASLACLGLDVLDFCCFQARGARGDATRPSKRSLVEGLAAN